MDAKLGQSLAENIKAINSKADKDSITKAAVGLGNVDNTSDANKPISTATKTALAKKVELGSIIQNMNNFGGVKLYNTALDDAMYAIDKRYYVKAALHNRESGGKTYPINTQKSDGTFSFEDGPVYWNLNADEIARCFDNAYERYNAIGPGKYLKIHIQFVDPALDSNPVQASQAFPGYPYGEYLLNYYYNNTPTEASQYRCYNTFESHKIGWHFGNFSAKYSTYGQSSFCERYVDGANYQRTQIEFIIFGRPASDTKTVNCTEVSWILDRPQSKDVSYISKFADDTIYTKLSFKQKYSSADGTGLELSSSGIKLNNKDVSFSDHNHDTAYLGITAKALDSDKLDGQDGSYYLNYNNLSNTPTLTDRSSATAISSSGTKALTERAIYYALPTINASHSYNSSSPYYCPTSAGTNGYILKSAGSGAPSWLDPSTIAKITKSISAVGTGDSNSNVNNYCTILLPSSATATNKLLICFGSVNKSKKTTAVSFATSFSSIPTVITTAISYGDYQAHRVNPTAITTSSFTMGYNSGQACYYIAIGTVN